MHNTCAESVALVSRLSGMLSGYDGADVVVAPPFTALAAVASFTVGTARSEIRHAAPRASTERPPAGKRQSSTYARMDGWMVHRVTLARL